MDKFLQIIIVLFAVLNSPDSSATQKADAINQARIQVNQIQIMSTAPTIAPDPEVVIPADEGISTGVSTSTPQMPPAPEPMRPGQRPSVSA